MDNTNTKTDVGERIMVVCKKKELQNKFCNSFFVETRGIEPLTF